MTTVAIALIERDGAVLIGRRRSDQVHAGKWEFPGGKVEDGETPPAALERELEEELGLYGVQAHEVLRYEYAYPGRAPVLLVFFRVTAYRGTVDGSQFAELRWEPPTGLGAFDFLAGDERIVRELAAGRYCVASAGV